MLPPQSEPKPGQSLYAALLPSVSRQRLDAYRQKGDSDLDLLALYNWNLCLAEALYPTLQSLEITFRNHLNDALVQKFGEYWMWNDPPLSRPDDVEQIKKAEANLLSNRKSVNTPRMVAELTFGFWTRLLDRRYERVLWPHLLRSVFPNIPAPLRRRDHISAHFEEIRRLRNRVSHHEPIWQRNLLDDHKKITEAISWMSPEMAELTTNCDRFTAVHSATFQQSLRLKLEQQSTRLHKPNLG